MRENKIVQSYIDEKRISLAKLIKNSGENIPEMEKLSKYKKIFKKCLGNKVMVDQYIRHPERIKRHTN